MGILAPLLLVAMVSAINGQPFEYGFPEYTRTALGDSVDIASMKLLKAMYDAKKDENIISSPLGVLTCLSLYASAAEGKNRDEIMTYLGAPEYKVLTDSYSELSRRFSSMDRSFLTLANKVFVSDSYSLQDEFLNTARSYRSEVANINFRDQKTTADTMNQWASENTKGIIDHPVSTSDIDTEAAVALLNVIFFQGHWHVPFNASETKEKVFHLDSTRSVKKPMMHLLQALQYRRSEELGALMIELPYKETKFRMIVVLPDNVDGVQEVLKKVSAKGLLEDVFQMRTSYAEVDLYLPKFEIKTKVDFNDILPEVGVSRIFAEPVTGLVKERSLVVSKVFQEAFVKVDEEGATAGAFTGLVAVPMSSHYRPPPPIPFVVDRPFLFAILHDDIVLFTGIYAK